MNDTQTRYCIVTGRMCESWLQQNALPVGIVLATLILCLTFLAYRKWLR